MSWRLAKSLIKLREQINAAHPTRSRVSDGSVGDARHQRAGNKSDHNPNAQGVVTAIDITHDPVNGVDGKHLSRALAEDKRTKYVIFAGEIYRSYKPHLGWAKYTGSNSHNKHVHISVVANGADDVSPWANLGQGDPVVTTNAPIKRSTLRRGDTGTAVQDLQRRLDIRVDGAFGPDTEHAVREFQAHHGLKVDGVVGKATNAVLFGDSEELLKFREDE